MKQALCYALIFLSCVNLFGVACDGTAVCNIQTNVKYTGVTAPGACGQAAAPGQECQIQDSGTYNGWTQTHKGLPGSPITIDAASGKTPVISTQYVSSGVDYVYIKGLTFTGTFATNSAIVYTGSNNHDIWQNITINGSTVGNIFHEGTGGTINNSQLLNVKINRPALDTNTGASFQIEGNNNLIDNALCNQGAGDCFDGGGSHNVIRYPTFIAPNRNGQNVHIDFYQNNDVSLGVSQFLLFESGEIKGCIDDSNNCHGLLVQTYTSGLNSQNLLFRFNKIGVGAINEYDGAGYSAGSGTGQGVTTGSVAVYNNTVWSNKNFTNLTGTGCMLAFNSNNATSTTLTALVRNMICVNVAAPASSSTPFNQAGSHNGTPTATIDENYNLVYTSGYLGDFGSTYNTEATYPTLHSQNPNLTSSTNFSLNSPSPAINGGTYLTTVGAGGCSGTTINLNKVAGLIPFQDGWGPDDATTVFPDWIRVGASTIRQFQKGGINYSTGASTMTSSLTCSPGDPVYLAVKSDGVTVLFGSAPDLGAVPFVPPVNPSNITLHAVGNGSTTSNGYSLGDSSIVSTYNGGTPALTCVVGTPGGDGLSCSVSVTNNTAFTVGVTAAAGTVITAITLIPSSPSGTGNCSISSPTSASCTSGNVSNGNADVYVTLTTSPTCSLAFSPNSVNNGTSVTGTATISNLMNQSGSSFSIFDPLNSSILGCPFPFSGGCSNTGFSGSVNYTGSGQYSLIACTNGACCTPATAPENVSSPAAGMVGH